MTDLDDGARECGAAETAFDVPDWRWIVVSFVAYIVLGLTTKTLVLNWIVGPLWLVGTLWALPQLWRRITGADRR